LAGQCPLAPDDIAIDSQASPSEPTGRTEVTPKSAESTQACYLTSEAADSFRKAIIQAAYEFVERPPKTLRGDCSSLVIAILARAGAQASGGSRDFWQAALRDGRLVEQPTPGDLAFFDFTYDANHNGLLDDLLTHVATVVALEPPATVVMVHWGSHAVKELRMTLDQPDIEVDAGRILNQPLRSPAWRKQHGPGLSGQLFHGFARPGCPMLGQ